jgi:hypothetical protein
MSAHLIGFCVVKAARADLVARASGGWVRFVKAATNAPEAHKRFVLFAFRRIGFVLYFLRFAGCERIFHPQGSEIAARCASRSRRNPAFSLRRSTTWQGDRPIAALRLLLFGCGRRLSANPSGDGFVL